MSAGGHLILCSDAVARARYRQQVHHEATPLLLLP
jgi:hypothetical protein